MTRKQATDSVLHAWRLDGDQNMAAVDEKVTEQEGPTFHSLAMAHIFTPPASRLWIQRLIHISSL